MNLFESWRVALRGLASNKMRTALTMLGIIIGVGVVIIVVAIGQGATQRVTDTINSLGTNLLTVRPGPPTIRLTAAVRSSTSVSASTGGATSAGTQTSAPPPPNHLTLEDARLIEQNFTQSISDVDPQSRADVQVRYLNKDATTTVMGVTPAYTIVNNTSVDSGRFLNNGDVEGVQKVCLVGHSVAEKLTGDSTTDLTGQTLYVNRIQFKVIGMLTAKGSGAWGQDQDDVVVVPVTTAMRRVLNRPHIDMISLRCVSQQMMPLAQEQIENFLRSRHHLRPPYPENDDFKVFNQTELLESQQSVTGTMTTLLSAVAVISLVVGGIGIMNIMLVSVTERTREIGIRKAIGATPRDIMMQFLIEAAIISLLGGLFGIGLGTGGATLIAHFVGWSVIVSSAAIFAALSVSAGIGVFFGMYPASKAAALHPIEALRYE